MHTLHRGQILIEALNHFWGTYSPYIAPASIFEVLFYSKNKTGLLDCIIIKFSYFSMTKFSLD